MGLKKKDRDEWMDGWRKNKRQRDHTGGGKREKGRAAENMRLKCNVLGRERANPGQVMQLEGTAHWQSVARIKKRRKQQTLFLYRLPF